MGTAKKITPQKRRDKACLEQTGGPGKGRTFELSRDVLRIGRTEDNEIVMKSESVSRCHAYMKRNMAGAWIFQDNNSKNGVTVNGERVFEAKLQDGDVLVVGDFTFEFFNASDPVSSEKTTVEAPTPIKQTAPERPRKLEKAEKKEKTAKHENLALDPSLAPFLQVRKTNAEHVLSYLEKYSWIIGLAVGLAIGGGLWFKASRVAPRPGAIVPEKPVAARTPSKKRTPEVTESAATFASEKAAPSEGVSKADMEVAPKATKKPRTDIRDLKVYLREGKDYLREGDKESAAVAFRFALVLDPTNREARSGLKAAGVKVDPLPKPPPKEERKPNTEAKKRAKVAELLKTAVEAFNKKAYQESIDKAEQARKIELAGSTEYLNEAKQIIDRARLKQKEDFEPFLESALQKIKEGDFKGGAALCEEMLRMDPSYGPARECVAKAVEGIGKKAK